MDQVRYAADLASPKFVGCEPGRTTGSVCSADVKIRVKLEKRHIGHHQAFVKTKNLEMIEDPLPVDLRRRQTHAVIPEGIVTYD